jgi:hypothetical protein
MVIGTFVEYGRFAEDAPGRIDRYASPQPTTAAAANRAPTKALRRNVPVSRCGYFRSAGRGEGKACVVIAVSSRLGKNVE